MQDWFTNSMTVKLDRVRRCKPSDQNPHEFHEKWLDALGDMAQNHLKWHWCIHFMSPRRS